MIFGTAVELHFMLVYMFYFIVTPASKLAGGSVAQFCQFSLKEIADVGIFLIQRFVGVITGLLSMTEKSFFLTFSKGGGEIGTNFGTCVVLLMVSLALQ